MIQERVDAIFAKMAFTVHWQDLRDSAAERQLQGYLTRGAGAEAPWEFRFRQIVRGLKEGAVLRGDDGNRWLVVQLVTEELEGELLYAAARVRDLEQDRALDEGLEPLLDGLAGLLERSALAALERDDVTEILARLPRLAADPKEPGHGARLKQRLQVLRQAFAGCPQTWHEARGHILRLEAALKRKGLP